MQLKIQFLRSGLDFVPTDLVEISDEHGVNVSTGYFNHRGKLPLAA
jgi:hypothetical protein